jgi:hypothetical protein
MYKEPLNITTWGRGWDRSDTNYMGVVSYGTASERTMTIAPFSKTGTTYPIKFVANGKQIILTESVSLACPDVTGTYYWYFDEDGELNVVLARNFNHNLFITSALVGLAYYNKEASTFEGALDEQHGIAIPSETHFYLHMTEGLKWSQGGEITSINDGGSTYGSIAQAVHHDEDIYHVTPAETTHSFMYRSGTDEDNAGWVFTAADNKVGHIVSGDTYACYNTYTGGSWQLVESTNSTDYIIYYIAQTNLATHHRVKVIGQETFASRSDARYAIRNSLTEINLQGLPSSEFEWQYAYIVKRDGTIEDDGKGEVYVDLRGIKINAI